MAKGEQNVPEAIRVVLMTNLSERLMLPDFGGNLNTYLFEPNTIMRRQAISDCITKALAAWEPRIRVESVVVDAGTNDSDRPTRHFEPTSCLGGSTSGYTGFQS